VFTHSHLEITKTQVKSERAFTKENLPQYTESLGANQVDFTHSIFNRIYKPIAMCKGMQDVQGIANQVPKT
jgi:hypothetical protein